MRWRNIGDLEEYFMFRFRRKWHRDATSIGHVLVEDGVCTKEQIQRASVIRGDAEEPLGEVLVHLRIITHHQLEVALARQKIRRSGGSGRGVSQFAKLTSERIKHVVGRADSILQHPMLNSSIKKVATK
jgi:hypothetical protein